MTPNQPASSSPGLEATLARANIGGEIVPLVERVRALAVLRVLITVAVLSLAAFGDQLDLRRASVGAAAYLAVTTLLSLAVYVPYRSVGLRAFGVALLVDSAYLQYLLQVAGRGLGVQFAVAAFLVAVTLLASFRTGIKIAIWSSILLITGHQAQVAGVLDGDPQRAGDLTMLGDLVLMWIVVITASTAGAINERELRRRRYDAEVLRALATSLHRSEAPNDVLAALMTFVQEELDAGRVLLCRDAPSGLALLVGQGLDRPAVPVDQHAADSPLLSMLSGADPVLALRLDPVRDPWLAGLMPGARRLVAVQLARGQEQVFLVLELLAPGVRVERRVIGTLEQAAATTALALSRADLLVQARRSASTDGLTGAWNRRTFDAELSRNVASARRDGVALGLIMVDVDHFKQVNDVHGHQVGDDVLVLVASTLSAVLASTGNSGTAFRYGGEEFSVLLPGADIGHTALVAERLRSALEALDAPVPVTASFGVSGFGGAAHDETTLLLQADAALLRAKQTGRNRVTVFDPAALTAIAP